MNERDRAYRWLQKEDFIDEIKAVCGAEPDGLRSLLAILTHPSLIEHTKKYFDNYGSRQGCLIYTEPWSCAREAEARYETIKYGWVGAASGVGFDESWCGPCRKRVLGGSLD